MPRRCSRTFTKLLPRGPFESLEQLTFGEQAALAAMDVCCCGRLSWCGYGFLNVSFCKPLHGTLAFQLSTVCHFGLAMCIFSSCGAPTTSLQAPARVKKGCSSPWSNMPWMFCLVASDFWVPGPPTRWISECFFLQATSWHTGFSAFDSLPLWPCNVHIQ